MMLENRPMIPESEFADRAKRLQEIMKRENVDILLAFGNEAEPQFARYLCDYWPSFETTYIFVPSGMTVGSTAMAPTRASVPE